MELRAYKFLARLALEGLKPDVSVLLEDEHRLAVHRRVETIRSLGTIEDPLRTARAVGVHLVHGGFPPGIGEVPDLRAVLCPDGVAAVAAECETGVGAPRDV